MRFLVVEDHDVQRRLLVQVLSYLGATLIDDAEDGRSALRIMADAEPPVDIVITDLSMPGMDGIELIRHIGEGKSGVSIILTSALEPQLLASVANMAQAYDVNLMGVVKKPPSAVKLMPMIEQYLAHKAQPPRGDGNEVALSAIARAFVNDEFEPHFQPIVNLANLRVEGMQALPVWRHPERGVLPAHVFMPAVESFGLGDDIVWMMLRKCAARSAEWKAHGLDLKVAVSLAFASLADLELAGRIETVVQREGAPTGSLLLGIGEPVVDDASARALENLVRLRFLGFELAVDDFGTGSKKADPLARVAFNALKFSRHGANGRGKGEPWPDLAVALDTARRIRVSAVADGITTPDDWNQLQEFQCHRGLGPLISKPLPGDEVMTWLPTWPPKPQRGVWTPTLLL